MPGRIDVHGHFLPELDDGSRSLGESVEMAKKLAEVGYTHLTCSPHIWPDCQYKPAFIQERVAELQRVLDAKQVPITLVPGGELNLTELDLFDMPDDEIPTYGMAKQFVLFDFWAGDLPDDYWERIDRLRAIGATPIQAHPERIAAFQYRPLLLDELRDRGVLLQCNLQCLSDSAGTRARDCAEQWLKDGRYFLLASDSHRIDTLDIRIAGLHRAIELLGDVEVDRLTRHNPANVIGIDV